MEVHPVAEIHGAVRIVPAPVVDDRGFFCRTFDRELMDGFFPVEFAQDSLSRSCLGVVRGLHVRRGSGEAKLVRCSYGKVFDVVVDLRRRSPTFLNWVAFELGGDEQSSVYIPAGCAHGFQALSDIADVSYRIDRPHDPSEDLTLAHDERQLAIPWPMPATVMSDKDRRGRTLEAVLADLA